MSELLFIFFILPRNYEITYENKAIKCEAVEIELQDYIPLRPITDILGINYIFDPHTQRLQLFDNSHKIILIGNIGVIKCDGLFKNMAFPPYYIAKEIYFPLKELTTIIGANFEKLIFIKELKEVSKIAEISILLRGDSTVVKFAWERPLDFDVLFNPTKTVIEIDGRYQKKTKLKATGAVEAVTLIPYNTYTRLELGLQKINAYIERKDEVVFFNKITKKVNLIVIDPGHGGIDPGAVGRTGLYEKDVVLDIGKILQNLIKDSLGINILLTREKDKYLSLKERTNIANRNSADIFVSIHCNASPKGRSNSRGFETYFLSEAKTDEARAVAARENASLRFDGIQPTDEVSFILYDLAQSAFLEESNRLAECIQSEAETGLSIPARGVNQAGFYVLKGAFMPSVLIETAFISNTYEERLLKKKDFRQKLADCIFKGIRNFVIDYEKRLNQ